MQPTHVPGLEIYDSHLKKKKKKRHLKHFCHSENVARLLFLLISQYSLEGSEKTELFVQDIINHVRPSGE